MRSPRPARPHRRHAHRVGLREAQRVHPRDESAEVLALAHDLAADGAALLGGETLRVHPLTPRRAGRPYLGGRSARVRHEGI